MYQSIVFVFILWVTVSKLCFLCFLTNITDVTSLYLPQDGVNWLAFLNRYKLHGILCDGILYFVFDAFMRFIYVRQYITFLCPCSVQSFGALVLSVCPNAEPPRVLITMNELVTGSFLSVNYSFLNFATQNNFVELI